MAEFVEVARQWIGISRYDFWEENSHPPFVVNCYTFAWWVYEQCGIFLPCHLLGQLYVGEPVKTDQKGGELVFLGGCRWGEYVDSDRARYGVGHVGILTEEKTVIHASQKAKTVVEVPYELFVNPESRFRGMYKIP